MKIDSRIIKNIEFYLKEPHVYSEDIHISPSKTTFKIYLSKFHEQVSYLRIKD